MSALRDSVLDSAGRRLRTVIRWSWITLGLLLVQNLLGMDLNLYVDLSAFPSVEDAFRSAPLLGIHVLIAFVIIATSAYVLARAVRTRHRTLQLAALVGFGFVLLAFFSGIEFTFYGQVDAFSFLMELGFVGIVGCVAAVLVTARDLQARSEPPKTSTAIPTGASPARPPETG